MMPFTLTLKPGDVLLYRSNGFVGWAIRTKSWSDVNHVETYLGDGLTAASRDFYGVNTYPIYEDTEKRQLMYVLRPNVPFMFSEGLAWHKKVIGQKYDLLGLFSSFFSSKGGSSTKQFCSEHAARFAKMAGYYPFGPTYDSDKVSPGMFLASPSYEVVYHRSQDLSDRS